jgi:hypothetical protein
MRRGFRAVELDVSRVDRVEPLFKGLVDFHRAVVEGAWPVPAGD